MGKWIWIKLWIGFSSNISYDSDLSSKLKLIKV